MMPGVSKIGSILVLATVAWVFMNLANGINPADMEVGGIQPRLSQCSFALLGHEKSLVSAGLSPVPNLNPQPVRQMARQSANQPARQAESQTDQQTEPMMGQTDRQMEQTDQQTAPMPGELWELLQRQSRPEQGAGVVFTLLRPVDRMLLLGGAVMILLAGVIICRRLRTPEGIFRDESNIFLLFGFFGSISAMFAACGCVGYLYLHLAAAVCTALSGFSITAFLAPQFSLTRRWVVGPEHQKPAEGDKK
jgi:biotin carboxyl carrier protein